MESMSIKLNMRKLLKHLDEESEGKIILKSILIFKGLKCLINKKAFCCLKNKHIPKPNTLILTEVNAVTGDVQSEHDI